MKDSTKARIKAFQERVSEEILPHTRADDDPGIQAIKDQLAIVLEDQGYKNFTIRHDMRYGEDGPELQFTIIPEDVFEVKFSFEY